MKKCWPKFKWQVLDWLGYIFCEMSMRWWDKFDNSPLIGPLTFWNKVTYYVGLPSYNLGCFFYNLQDDAFITPLTIAESIATIEAEEEADTD